MSDVRPVLHPTLEDARLHDTVWAINLLGLRRPWAYALYNFLAFRSVRAVGGRPFVKGVNGAVIAGDSETSGAASGADDALLIVAYPRGDAFLALLRKPFFLAVSVLRRLGLRSFEFAFARRLDPGPGKQAAPAEGDEKLLALLWPDDAPNPDIQALDRTVRAADAALLFAGRKQAILALEISAEHGEPVIKPTRKAPPMPWSHVAVAAGTEGSLRSLAGEPPAGVAKAVLYRRTL